MNRVKELYPKECLDGSLARAPSSLWRSSSEHYSKLSLLFIWRGSPNYFSTIRQVQEFSEDLHWFCPRHEDDNEYYFPEDLQDDLIGETEQAHNVRTTKLQEAKARKALVLESLQIFAFDGKDAAQYQVWMKERLMQQMTRCDVCTREYYRGRRDLKQKLEE